MYEKLIELVKSQRNVFLTGQGGTGKSYLINQLKKEIDIDVTSTTGISAYLIKGSTIHSYCGIGVLSKYSVKDVLKKIKKNKLAKRRLIECKTLVIDEISMLGKKYFEMMNETFKLVRNDDRPFGGICIILTGDFMQLPPINDGYVFESDVWDELNLEIIKLEKVYRQTDEIYKGILSRVRLGKQTNEDNVELYKRVKAYHETNFDDIKPTFLTSRRTDVDQMNKDELEKNPNDLVIYKAEDDDKNLDWIAPSVLYLKVGAQVMLTVNINVERGLANGSRGVVMKLGEMVYVKFLSGEIIPFERHEFKYEEDDKVSTRKQFPFILAYCTSIYKSQGSTLDMAVIDLGYTVFGHHSVYVALSRVRSLKGLYLKSYIPNKITVDERVVDFYS